MSETGKQSDETRGDETRSGGGPADGGPVGGGLVWRRGLREGLGMPGLVIFGSFLGFGSLVHASGIGLAAGLVSSATTWALPGQIAMVELYGIGASLVVNVMAVWLTNTRLMPMVITLLPQLRHGRGIGWRHYLVAHLIAITSWAVALRRCPEMPPEQRFSWFAGFAAALWAMSFAGTAIGFQLAGSLPQPVTMGLVFLNPCYFTLLFVADPGPRVRVLALALGGALGPALHLATPEWGLLITGIAGGTAAFLVDRALPRRGARAAGLENESPPALENEPAPALENKSAPALKNKPAPARGENRHD